MKSLMSIMKDPRIVGAMGVAKELKLTEELGRAQFLSQGWQKGSTTCRCLPTDEISKRHFWPCQTDPCDFGMGPEALTHTSCG